MSFLRSILFCLLIQCCLAGSAQKRIKVACVGNSITYGATIENQEVNSYPAQLAAMLGRKYDVRNFGRSGTTLLSKGDYPYIAYEEYQEALAFQPDLVFIKLGTNDTKPANRVFLDDFVDDFKKLISSFKQLPSHPRIVLLLPVPAFVEGDRGITASVICDNILPKVRQVAFETETEIINLYNLLIDSPALFTDGIHPSASGARIIALRISDYMKMKTDSCFDLISKLPRDKNLFNFYGFPGYEFSFMGRTTRVVVPKRVAPGHPGVWRARFWGHEPQFDIAMLERGFHIVYNDVSEWFGNEDAITMWNQFYGFLTTAGLGKKALMEGMSRGGFYVYRWAVIYPQRVAAVYADAPVLDIKSWPGGKGKSEGSQDDWNIFMADFHLNDENAAMSFDGNPLDKTDRIAKAGFPMLHVVGDADTVVPVAENSALFEKKIKDARGRIQLIHKPEIGHHPHSLQNPQPIVDFALKAFPKY